MGTLIAIVVLVAAAFLFVPGYLVGLVAWAVRGAKGMKIVGAIPVVGMVLVVIAFVINPLLGIVAVLAAVMVFPFWGATALMGLAMKAENEGAASDVEETTVSIDTGNDNTVVDGEIGEVHTVVPTGKAYVVVDVEGGKPRTVVPGD